MSVSDGIDAPKTGFPYVSNKPDKWDDEAISLLRRLVEEKLSAREIAAAMSQRTTFMFTRNAIIGKVRRLGLALLSETVVKPKKPRTVKRLNPVTALKFNPQKSAPTSPQQPTFEEVVANPKALTILEMRSGQCYWPTSHAFDQASEDIRFCGHATEIGASWCSAHARLGYVKPMHRVGWNYRS